MATNTERIAELESRVQALLAQVGSAGTSVAGAMEGLERMGRQLVDLDNHVTERLDEMQDQWADSGVGVQVDQDDPQAALRARVQRTVERWAQPPEDSLAKLPKPTSRDNQKGRCDVCGGWHGLPAIHLDYMGHADVTLALLEVDPAWELQPVLDAQGLPVIEDHGHRLTMWAYLTVNGVRRMCVGTCESGKGDPEKELLGDAIRNGAMRFGIGTRLWSKADGADPFSSAGDSGGRSTPEAAPPEDVDQDTMEAEQLYRQLRDLAGTPAADHMKAWVAEQQGSLQLEPLRNPEWRGKVLGELERWQKDAPQQVPEGPVPPSDGPGLADRARAQVAEQLEDMQARQAEHVPAEDTEVLQDTPPDEHEPAPKQDLCLAQPPAELEHYMACTLPADHTGDHRWEEPF